MIKDLETTYVLFYNSRVYHIVKPTIIYPSRTYCHLWTDVAVTESKTPPDNYPLCSKCQRNVSLKSGKD